MDGRTSGWMDGWMDGWLDGWVGGHQISGSVGVQVDE